MDVLFNDTPRLSIKPTRNEPRCLDAQGVSWPVISPILLPSGAAAVICVVMPDRARRASSGQVVCP